MPETVTITDPETLDAVARDMIDELWVENEEESEAVEAA